MAVYDSEVKDYGMAACDASLAPADQAKALPHRPGVYLMRNDAGTVIYVGKAKDLRRRVTSYFLSGRDVKTTALVKKIRKIEHIITGTEYEALVFENNLIKKYSPHYNIALKDGKSYPVIRITNEDFPKVFGTRRIIDDGSSYFGPYPVVGNLKMYLDLVEKLFPLRKCGIPLRKKDRPCMYYHIGKCKAPCCGKITKEEYAVYIDQIKKFLNGDNDALIEQVRKEMIEASRNLNFELAASKRDLMQSLQMVSSTQQVEDFVQESRDYAAIEMRGTLCTVSLMQMRDGALMGRALYRAETLGDETETLLGFLVMYYSDGRKLPNQLYVSCDLDTELIKQYFMENFNGKLDVENPKDGKHYRILRMASLNAARDVDKRLKSKDNTPSLEALRDVLGLEKTPTLIEGFDIAHLAGKYTVASLISFRDGNPDRANYRRFNMKTLDGRIDDYSSMREAVGRRYSRVLKENLEIPGLIMVDGGKGQVHVAREVLDDLGLVDVPLIGLAEKFEEIVFPDDRDNLILDEDDPALQVLIALRDECHRFANTANRKARQVDSTFKVLESIKGIGKVRSRAIMEKYLTVEELLRHSDDEIARDCRIPKNTVALIRKKLEV